MKTKVTELVFILDRSGSMAGLESDTIGGFNSMLEKQKNGEGEVLVTTVLFDDHYELLHDRTNIKDIAPLTEENYFVRGSTALLDAIGRSIDTVGNAQKYRADEAKSDNVLFVITTDGMENASREYNHRNIKYMIERQKEKYNWEFLFLGANIDAMTEAAKIGINRDRAVNYHADSRGTKLNYEEVGDAIRKYRKSPMLNVNWKKKIEKDYADRK